MQNMSALARRWNTSLATHHTATVLQSLQNNSYRQHIERTVSGPAIIGLEEFGPSRLKEWRACTHVSAFTCPCTHV
jgi:hypothetical protein